VLTTSVPARSARFAEVDLLKAVGILVVVFIHTIRSGWERDASGIELWLGEMTRFAVPGFLAASGFLYAGESADAARTAGRLQRVVAPYLLFTAVAQLQRTLEGLGPRTQSHLADWLLAGSFGPYYYVFVATAMVLLTPLLARIPARVLPAVVAVEVALQLALATFSKLDFFWHLRNPLLWLAYFHLGWLARLHHAKLVALATRHRTALVAGSGLLFAVLALSTGLVALPRLRSAIGWAAIYPALACLLFAGCGRASAPLAPGLVRWLSDATYAVYLVHLFFLYPLREAFDPPFRRFDALAIAGPWLLALAASLAFVALARRLLGERSRTWIGA